MVYTIEEQGLISRKEIRPGVRGNKPKFRGTFLKGDRDDSFSEGQLFEDVQPQISTAHSPKSIYTLVEQSLYPLNMKMPCFNIRICHPEFISGSP